MIYLRDHSLLREEEEEMQGVLCDFHLDLQGRLCSFILPDRGSCINKISLFYLNNLIKLHNLCPSISKFSQAIGITFQVYSLKLYSCYVMLWQFPPPNIRWNAGVCCTPKKKYIIITLSLKEGQKLKYFQHTILSLSTSKISGLLISFN